MALARLKEEADAVDCYVSRRVRERRNMLGLSLQEVANLVGVACPQVHRYENGFTRIASSRLFEIGQALGVEVGYFFEGMAGEQSPELTSQQRALLELSRHFLCMTRKHQEQVSKMARSLAYPPLVLVDDTPREAVAPRDSKTAPDRMIPVILETPSPAPSWQSSSTPSPPAAASAGTASASRGQHRPC